MYRLRPSPRPSSASLLEEREAENPNGKKHAPWRLDQPQRLESLAEVAFYGPLDRLMRSGTGSPVTVRLQEAIGPYRADFTFRCRDMRAVVEIDGWRYHKDKQEEDAERDRRMEALNWMVIRIQARDILIRGAYAQQAAQACIDLIKGWRSISSINAGNEKFHELLWREHPEFVVPRGTCLNCHGKGVHEFERRFDTWDDEMCEACDGTGREPRGTFRDMSFWNVEAEAASLGLRHLVERARTDGMEIY